jgi:signal transduction histidine kinase/DNA-binding response OmpR family regulator
MSIETNSEAPRILVVDDEAIIRHVLRSILDEKKCRVEVVDSAEAAVRKLEEGRFDVALFDIVLPGRDGLSLLEQVKRRWPDTEVVMMTSQGSIETSMRALRSGAYDYVLKPFEDTEGIWRTIARALEHRQLVTRNRALLAEAESRNHDLNAAVARLSSLIEAGRAMAAVPSLDELLDAFVDLVTRELDVERASLMLVDENSRQLTIGASRGVLGVDVETVRVSLGEGVAGTVAKTGKPWLVESVSDDPRTVATKKEYLSASFISAPVVLSVPIATGSKVLGVINVTNRRSGLAFSNKDLDYLAGLAGQAAVAIERARHLDALQAAYESLKSAQQQLVVSERRKVVGQMAAGVAHDFNNLLSVILGRAELALERGSGGAAIDDVRADVDVIRKTALQGVGVVKRIQEYTRIRRDSLDEAVDLRRVVRDAVEMTRPKWSGAADGRGGGIDVVLELGDLPAVTGNAHELGQVVSNLIFNAVDAMPNGGTISFRTAMKDGAIVLQISDTGVGMDDETRRHLFEPFFTTKPQGQGLGTSIVHSIISRHGGTVTATSRPGAGTTFVIALRPHGAAVAGANAVREAASTADASSARVLLVDDDESVRETIEAALIRGGHFVESFGQAQAALDALEAGHFDLVVTDLTMPVMNGFEVARTVKRGHPDLPVLLLTGWAVDRDDREAREAGVDHILAKPCPIDELLQTVSGAIGKGVSPASSPDPAKAPRRT